ncbi:MAG: hypothetical protein ACOYA9_12110 [Bilifractor sp.]|jgi:hypothetical protein
MKKAKKITQAMTDCYATIENEMKKMLTEGQQKVIEVLKSDV